MSWILTTQKDISFEHCGQPAYWNGDDVFCSKCQEMLGDAAENECEVCHSALIEDNPFARFCDACYEKLRSN